MQSIPPTTANKQTQAQKQRGTRARKLLGANAKSYRLKLTIYTVLLSISVRCLYNCMYSCIRVFVYSCILTLRVPSPHSVPKIGVTIITLRVNYHYQIVTVIFVSTEQCATVALPCCPPPLHQHSITTCSHKGHSTTCSHKGLYHHSTTCSRAGLCQHAQLGRRSRGCCVTALDPQQTLSPLTPLTPE